MAAFLVMVQCGAFARSALAHEAYVLTPEELRVGLSTAGLQTFRALRTPANLKTFLAVSVGVLMALAISFCFRRTEISQQIDARVERFARWGPRLLRLSIAASLLASAWTNSFLGPELSLERLPFAPLVRALIAAIGILFAFGFATELAAAIMLIIFVMGFWTYGAYLATYLNYLGEVVALLLFGARSWSLDRMCFGALRRFPKLRQYETTIVRLAYGLALMYAAISVKLLHPAITMMVVQHYHLAQFHLLFPSDPLLITLGAALAEFAIGLFIFLGFELRFAVLVSLFYITLSLFYFREAVWPHLLLYGISFDLLLNQSRHTVDRWLARRFCSS